MRYRIVRADVMCGVVLGMLLLQVAGQGPMAQTAGPDPVPADCRDMPLPSAMPFALDQYEARLHKFLQAQCYIHLGWTHDARVRDTGPWIAQFAAPDGDRSQPYQWSIANYGLHGTVFIYYSPDVFRWMQDRDSALREGRDLATLRPIADGSMILKFMLAGDDNKTTADFPDMRHLPETAIAAIVKEAPIALMVKDAKGAKDGWFWGTWYLGTSAKDQQDQIDWPPPPNFPFPWMEAGNYCVNCHASARSEFTYSATSHVLGDPETFPTFMITGTPPMLHAPKTRPRARLHHLAVLTRQDGITRVSQPRPYFPATAFLETFSAPALPPMRNIFADTALHMPPESYDHVVAGAAGAAQFLTSDQCVGCHAAGATGLRFDMTVQTRPGGLLVNLAPYGEWRASPMGLAGRDPIFFSQLETERTVHAPQEKVIQDLCLHCHGAPGHPGAGGARNGDAGVDKLHTTDTELVADVTITSLVGHKFPSGVGFRRAFIEFAVLDKDGVPLWTSGRTNSQGALIDAQGHPVRGEYFWKPACGVMTPEEQQYQPHFQEITRQDQVQIYQELTQDPQGKLTTSFLSIARRLKDNRLLPKGWNPNPKLAEREGLGSVKMPIPELIAEMQPVLPAANGQPELDPNFVGGSDRLTYRIPLASLPDKPASVQATLYYQAIPPFYLQDRFCTTGHQPDTERLYAMAGYLQLDGTQAAHWKLALVSSGVVSLTQ